MPTIRPASKTSRKTMINAGKTPATAASPHHKDALGRARVKIVKEFILAGLLRPDINNGLAIAGQDLLNPEAVALEFHRRRIEVLNTQRDRLACRRFQLCGIELVILHGEYQLGALLRQRGYNRAWTCHQSQGCAEPQCRRPQYPLCNPCHRQRPLFSLSMCALMG